jgi:hypothetical protein
MMLHDNPESRPETGTLDRSLRTPADAAPQLADDAEQFAGTPLPDAIHRWLDGENVEAELLAAPETAAQLPFWSALGQETARRRAMVTPPHVAALILERLEAPVVRDD